MTVKRNDYTIERCLNQVFRPKHHFPFLNHAGKGNCTICSYDPDNNRRCTSYSPISVRLSSCASEDQKTEGGGWKSDYTR